MHTKVVTTEENNLKCLNSNNEQILIWFLWMFLMTELQLVNIDNSSVDNEEQEYVK